MIKVCSLFSFPAPYRGNEKAYNTDGKTHGKRQEMQPYLFIFPLYADTIHSKKL